MVMIYIVFGFEKRIACEVLARSLPVKPSTIVIARYLSSCLIMITGIILFSLLAVTLDALISDAATDFEKLKNFGDIFIYIFVCALLNSFAFPIIFRYGMAMGGLISLAIGAFFFLAVPIVFPDSVFNGIETMIKISHYAASPGFYLLLSSIIIVLMGISALLSIKLYMKKDL